MVRQRDPFWEYGEDLKGRFRCNFCKKDYPGGVARLKSHLSRKQGRDVAVYPTVSDDVQAAALCAIMENDISNKRSKTESSCTMGGGVSSSINSSKSLQGSTLRQATLPPLCNKKKKVLVDKSVSNFFYMNNISFNVIKSPSFMEMINSIGEFGVGYTLPSYSTLRSKLVTDGREDVDEYVSTVKKTWGDTGCTLMSDIWTDMKSRSVINVVAYSPKGAAFLRSFDRSGERKMGLLLRDVLSTVIDEIGPEYVVQLVTDNASNYENADDLIMERYPHIYKTKCAAHGVQLLLKDIYEDVEWIRSIFDDAKMIVDYMYKHAVVLALLRKHTDGKELRRHCKTRFASHFIMLQSVLKVEDELRLLVASPEWRGLNYSNRLPATEVTEKIQSISFWKEGSEVISTLEPLVRVLRLVDGEGSTAGYLYEVMERARTTLKHRHVSEPSKYTKILSLFNSRRDVNIIHKVHAVAAYLNPPLMYDGKIRYGNPEVKEGLLYITDKYFESTEENNAFGAQLMTYNAKSSDLFNKLSVPQMRTFHPRIWWEANGDSIPLVQKVAIRILSQPCSSSTCERNWSAFEAVQTKKRNKLSSEMLENLVYICMNTKMMVNADDLEKRDKKPIDLEKLGEFSEDNDDDLTEFDSDEDYNQDTNHDSAWLDNLVLGNEFISS